MSNYAIYHIIFNMIFQAHYNGENHKVYITVSFCHIEMDETTKFTSHACLFFTLQRMNPQSLHHKRAFLSH